MDGNTSTHDLTPHGKFNSVLDEENEPGNSSSEKLISERHSTISQDKIPKLGMEFDNEEAAHTFYNEYARLAGFSVRRHTVHRDAKGNILDRIFCCGCQGHRQKDKRDMCVKSHRPEIRNGCRAMMKIDCRYNGKYKIVNFVSSHNTHGLVSPTKTHFLRSHRSITAALASQADNLDRSGITPRAGFALMANQMGGRENIGFIFEDYKNYLRTKRTVEMKTGDTGGVLEYLQQRQLDDPNFFYAIQVDQDDLIANILWIDAQMMVDYGHFGDVVSFDTTYRKNKDGRPFALFVGVNHHKQTIIFGAALLYDETTSTFMWLFDTFARAMSGKKPLTILTDQDAAMAKALATNWPDTCHRLCIWHIYQNSAIHLSSVFARFTNLSKEFSSCIYDYEEEEDFLNAWKEMLRKYGLETNEWLERLFKIKEKWALVYGRQYFCADLTTTQRSESINGVLKRYVSYKNNMLQFFQHFDRLVVDRRYAELQADLRSSQSTPVVSFPVEVVKATTVYTHEVFMLFQEELRMSYDAKINLSSEVGETFEYKVTLFRKHHQHTVMYDSSGVKVSCSRKKFEFAGILCSHALKVLSLRNIIKIPEFYIKKRWTKKAKKSVVQEEDLGKCKKYHTYMDEKEEKELIGVRYKELCTLSYQLGARASATTETFKIAKDGLLKLIEEIDVTLENGANRTPTLGTKFVQQNNALDESRDKSNGNVIRGWKKKEKTRVQSAKRPKSGLEMSIRKKKKRQTDKSLSIDTVRNEENIDQGQNVNTGKNCSRIDASFDYNAYSSSSQLSQEYQPYMSNSGVMYPTERFALTHVQPFQVAQTFNPVAQSLYLSNYSRQNEQNEMSLTELLKQQLVKDKTQGIERFQRNNSTNESQLEKIIERRDDMPKG